MSFFLVFLAVVLIGAALFLGSGIARSGRRNGDALAGDGFGEPVPNLPPVLLPEDATPGDVDRVRFSLGLRGYRMDQVDEVLDELRNQLASRNQEIERLKRALADMAEVPEAREEHKAVGTAEESEAALTGEGPEAAGTGQ